MAENQRILDEWQKAFEKNGGNADNFSWDGILFKGEVYREGGSDNWVRKESDNDTVENELWDNAPIRILFLTKDQNVGDGGAWDSRINSFREKNTIIRLANAWPILHMDWLIRQTTKMSP